MSEAVLNPIIEMREAADGRFFMPPGAGAASHATLPVSERLDARLAELLPDLFRQQEEDFHAFSECYWLQRAHHMGEQIVVPLLDMPGAELLPDDEWIRSGHVQLELHIGERQSGKYTWLLDAVTQDSRVSRTLVVDEAGVSGSMVVQTPDSRLRDFAWERQKELVWANDRIINKKPTRGPNPEGRVQHELSQGVLSYLMRTIQGLAMHPAAKRNGTQHLPLDWLP